ncbi:T9SS type A sorting domain-containing protein [Maribellus mangrovi]|uniref:T9SS type A sorting domain-containing protein n=1 Tax=Maribellus mangrovi TaxID=3133146 RepID=UPI0030EEE71D
MKSRIFTYVTILVLLTIQSVSAQSWYNRGSLPESYDMGGNPMNDHGTTTPGYVISNTSSPPDGFGTYMTIISASQYLGKAIKLSAYVKSEDVTNWAGLWVRVDREDGSLTFDNMSPRHISGTTDWTQCEIILDVPVEASEIYFGLLLDGDGKVWVDGLKLEQADKIWETQNSGLQSDVCFSIQAIDENVVWVGGENGYYSKTDDGGATWSPGKINNTPDGALFSVAVINSNVCYFLWQNWNSGDARIYKTVDGGANWVLSYRNITPGVWLNSIAFWNENEGIATGDPIDGEFLVVTTSDGGSTWEKVAGEYIPNPKDNEVGFTANGGTSLAVQGDGNVWFGTFNQTNSAPVRIFRSNDYGNTWNAVTTPISTNGEASVIATIAFKDSLTGFAGVNIYPYSGSDSTLLQTTDGGYNWSFVESFLPINPNTIAFIPGTNSLFVTSLQGTGFSEDGGLTWRLVSTEILAPMSFGSTNSGWAGGNFEERQVVKYYGDFVTSIPANAIPYSRHFDLDQNYPNPFNSITQINYDLLEATQVQLSLYDLAGRKIKILVDEHQQQGLHSFQFNASNLHDGIYIYELRTEESIQSRRMIKN